MSVPKVDEIKLNNGVKMPMLGLGTFHAKPSPDLDEIEQAVYQAIQVGYRHFDCAYEYRNEEGIGKAFQRAFKDGIVTREELFVVSKVWLTFTRTDRVKLCLKKSLDRLKLNYLDLYLIHWPLCFKQVEDTYCPVGPDGQIAIDDSIDYLDTWKGMEQVYQEGLVRAIGICNFNSQQLDRLIKNSKVIPVINQIESHPYLPQIELIDFCHRRNVAVTAYSPLGCPGMQVPGFIKPEHVTKKLMNDPVVKEIAAKYSRSSAQVLLRYQIDRGIVVIPRTVFRDEMIDNLKIFEFKLDGDDLKRLNGLACGWRSMTNEYLGINKTKDYPFNIPF